MCVSVFLGGIILSSTVSLASNKYIDKVRNIIGNEDDDYIEFVKNSLIYLGYKPEYFKFNLTDEGFIIHGSGINQGMILMIEGYSEGLTVLFKSEAESMYDYAKQENFSNIYILCNGTYGNAIEFCIESNVNLCSMDDIFNAVYDKYLHRIKN